VLAEGATELPAHEDEVDRIDLRSKVIIFVLRTSPNYVEIIDGLDGPPVKIPPHESGRVF